MDPYLTAAAAVAMSTAVLHSYLGERFILIRLFRRSNLPHLFGSDVFTKRTLRFAWHLTSVAWCGFGALLVLLARQPSLGEGARITLLVITWTFGVSAVYAFSASRGRHFSWVLFGAIALGAWLGSR